MKAAIHKSPIPESHIFVIRELDDKYFDPQWHAHSEYQLFVVLEGTGTRFIGDSIKSFKSGELVLTGKDLPHLWRSDEGYMRKGSNLHIKGIVIYLQEDFMGAGLMEKEEMAILKKLFKKSSRGLEFFGEERQKVIQLMKNLLPMRGLNSLIHLLQILSILAHSKNYEYISHKEYTDVFNESETDRMNKVYEYVLANFKKKIYLPQLAEMLYMTPTSFSRYFSSRNNKSFSQFISEIRIRHACKLLADTNLPIATISYECGFNTPSNFNKIFKDIMLKSPSAYKQEFSLLPQGTL